MEVKNANLFSFALILIWLGFVVFFHKTIANAFLSIAPGQDRERWVALLVLSFLCLFTVCIVKLILFSDRR